MRAALAWLAVIAVVVAGYMFGRDYVRRHPQDVPWTKLRLTDPIGRFTLRKVNALADEPRRCRALIRAAGTGDVPAPPRREGPDCGYSDGIRLAEEARSARFSPAGVITSCPVAAALAIYERDILQPAARRHFRTSVVGIDHAGSYSCRRLYGRLEGGFSEHATADAIDIIGFRLGNGTEVSVLRDWQSAGAKAAFLRDVRDGGCKLFSTVLSPDYNAAHADHLHFDQAARGRAGWSLCR